MRYLIVDCPQPVSITLYWNNDNGWGAKASATKFNSHEKETVNVPLGGYWVHVQDRWKNAVNVQDAVNLSGVARSFVEAINECHLEGMGTMEVRNDEAVRLFVNKMSDMTRQHEIDSNLQLFGQLIDCCEKRAAEN